jgi:threonine dehydrogenase-like Zn-dependent dehydrogenase
MRDRLADYRRGDAPLRDKNEILPLYGAGFENLGRDGRPIHVPMPRFGPDELLVRHDACGLCFSDIKIIRLGEEHPRIFRNMRTDPVVPGHEVVMTVVGVGENLRADYRPGDRFVVQADIYAGGVNYAYGYMIQGGFSRYGVIDRRILDGDDGNYLVPVGPGTGYAEAALVEPWACVIATYQLTYRSKLKDGGTTWIIGTGGGTDQRYTISAGFDEMSHPGRLLLTDLPADFGDWLRARADALGVEVVEVDDMTAPPVERVDDLVLLGADPDVIDAVASRLGAFGIMAIVADRPLARKVGLDVGRVHYDDWLTVGGVGPDIAGAYANVPVRSALKPGGRALFVGAGGPMGRMHVQRAIETTRGPAAIVCTDVSDRRREELRTTFARQAETKGVDFVCLNPAHEAEYLAGLAPFEADGFDDIIVMVPAPAVIAEAASHLARLGVMNVFAGVARGTMADIDLSDVYLRDVRIIGHSASSIEDMRVMLGQVESGTLSPNRSVAAVGSLSATKEGLQAVRDATYPGKIVVYPHIKDMPVTPLADLRDRLPTVYARLKNGREWTNEAEEEFLRLMLE